MDVHTLPCLTQVTKALRQSTGKSAQLGGSLAGRGAWGRMDARTCVPESLHCSPETVTTLLISYTLFYSYTRLKVEKIKSNISSKILHNKGSSNILKKKETLISNM